MILSGLQKMTLLDYPGHVACTVFLPGCNFRCPFCHNSGLLDSRDAQLSQEDLLHFLEKRTGLLDAVCITGGEPTLSPGLGELLSQIKALGFSVKLDTNGTRPAVLKALAGQGLLDYVAMDVKNSPACYGQTVGVPRPDLSPVEESLRFLMEGHVNYELRTTVVEGLHSEASITAMGQWLAGLIPGKKPEKLFLQCFVDRESVLQPGLRPPETATLEKYSQILAPFVHQVSLRGT